VQLGIAGSTVVLVLTAILLLPSETEAVPERGDDWDFPYDVLGTHQRSPVLLLGAWHVCAQVWVAEPIDAECYEGRLDPGMEWDDYWESALGDDWDEPIQD